MQEEEEQQQEKVQVTDQATVPPPIKIYDYEDYEDDTFAKNFRDFWFQERSEYDENGVFKDDPYHNAYPVIREYMKHWCMGHGVSEDSPEAQAERDLVTPRIKERYKIPNITPEEAEQRWQDYLDSDEHYEDENETATMEWKDMIANLSGTRSHHLRISTFIIVGTSGRWNGNHHVAEIWHTYCCESLGDLIKQFCGEFLSHCNSQISIYGDFSDGAINFYGSHHDANDSYSLYAINEDKLVDDEGEYISLEMYLDNHDMAVEDCIGTLTESLPPIVKRIWDGKTEIADIFKPYKSDLR